VKRDGNCLGKGLGVRGFFFWPGGRDDTWVASEGL